MTYIYWRPGALSLSRRSANIVRVDRELDMNPGLSGSIPDSVCNLTNVIFL